MNPVMVASYDELVRRPIGRMKVAHILRTRDFDYLLDFGVKCQAVDSKQRIIQETAAGRDVVPQAASREMWERFVSAPFVSAFDFACPGTMKGILLVVVRAE